MKSIATLIFLAALIFGAPTLAQRKITCPNGEIRYEVDVKKLAIQYEGWSLSGTLSSLSVLGSRISVDPKTLQQVAVATQQWNEFLKGLALGYNSCVVSKEQYYQALQRIYPRLKEDAVGLEGLRQLIIQGRKADEKRLKSLLESYFDNLRRFVEISGKSLLLERIAAVVDEVANNTEDLIKGQDEILKRLSDLETKIAQEPLATPGAIKTEIGKRLAQKSDEAESAYIKGYELFLQFRFAEAVPYFRRALESVKLVEFYFALGTTLLETSDVVGAEGYFREGISLAVREGNRREEARLLNQLGVALATRGMLVEGLKSLQASLEIAEGLAGVPAWDIASTINNIGSLLIEKGDFKGAVEHLQRALQIIVKSLGSEHPYAAICANNLGQALRDQGNLDAALDYARRAVEISDGIFEPEDINRASYLSNVGIILFDKHRIDEASDYFQRALDITERHFGSDHPRVASIVGSLGMVFLARGNFERALEYNKRALAITENVFGPIHPDVALLASNVAQVFAEVGDLENALNFQLRALSIVESALGPDHSLVATISNNIAGVLLEKGDVDGALRYSRRALRVSEKFYGLSHPRVALVANNLGQVLMADDDLDGALQYAERALKIYKGAGKDESFEAGIAYRDLGKILEAKGDLDKSSQNIRRAIQIHERVAGFYHPEVAKDSHALAAVLIKKHDFDGALEHNLNALKINEKFFGSTHLQIAYVVRDLGVIYCLKRDPVGFDYFERALGIFRSRSDNEWVSAVEKIRDAFKEYGCSAPKEVEKDVPRGKVPNDY